MSHIDDDSLALNALGEDALNGDQRSHLQDCPDCARTARELGHVVSAARTQLGTAATDMHLVSPPARVWSRVATELDLGSAARGTVIGTVLEPRDIADVNAARINHTPDDEPSRVEPRRPSSAKRRGWPRVLVAASVALVLGIGGGIWWERVASEPRPGVTMATATLVALPGGQDATGEAAVQVIGDRRQIVVTVDAPALADAYREVWLLRPDAGGLVSLGVLDGNKGRFDLPPGLDLAEFPVVDVSAEAFDGNPAHSGDSIVRGVLNL